MRFLFFLIVWYWVALGPLCSPVHAQWGSSNARRINGVPVCATAPSLNQQLIYDSNGRWCPSTPAGGGDVTGAASSVDSEIALFSGTGGKTIKRATGTGLAKLTSGVLGTASAGSDYENPLTFGNGLIRATNTVTADPQAVQVSVVDLSAAQVKALTTAVQLVAAPGAGKIVWPISLQVILNYGTTAFSGGSPSIEWIYNTTGTVYVQTGSAPNSFVSRSSGVFTGAADRVLFYVEAAGFANTLDWAAVGGSAGVTGANLTNRMNQPISLFNSGTDFTAGDSTMRVIMRYVVLDLGL